jgi:hypothetical protein
MASTTNAKTTPASTPSSGSTGGGSTQDTKLLNLIRANAQQIIAAINLAAAREGEQENWLEMNEYTSLAYHLGQFCPTVQVAGGMREQTMAAGSGR